MSVAVGGVSERICSEVLRVKRRGLRRLKSRRVGLEVTLVREVGASG
jgi:hypothetical protein